VPLTGVDVDTRITRPRWSPGDGRALGAALAIGALAVSPPVDEWAHTSLTVHMTQHTVLIGLVAPLLALGSPAPPRAWGAGWLGPAVVAHTVLILMWHAPPLFDAAEHNVALHIVEHACFVAAGWALWWTAARAGGPRGWGPGALAVFVSLFPMTVLGVGLLFSRTTWYTHHDDLVDQQVGGVVMWAGGGVLALGGAVAVAVAWISHGAAQSASSPSS
jgi:putative membrane protein